MITKLFASANLLTLFFAALLLLCGAATNAKAQSQINNAAANWNNVKALTIGQRVIVKTKTGEIAKGLINQVTDEAIVLIGKKQPVTISRENVRQLYTAKKSRALGIALGIAGGVGGVFVGTGLTVLIAVSVSSIETASLIGAPLIIGLGTGGAILGYQLGSRVCKGQLIYRSN